MVADILIDERKSKLLQLVGGGISKNEIDLQDIRV